MRKGQSRPSATGIELPRSDVMVPVVEATGTEDPVRVARVDVDIRIHGFVADTAMTLVSYNPNDRILAGDLYFPLREGTTVSGFALDVEGRMMGGAPVEEESIPAFHFRVKVCGSGSKPDARSALSYASRKCRG